MIMFWQSPPTIQSSNNAVPYFVPAWFSYFSSMALSIFGTIDEHTAYCQSLDLCPKRRTVEEEDAFKKG